MTFTTLEDRFKATADTLYKRYENTQQLDPIRPNTAASRSRIKDDSRGAPIVSTGRDLKLMGNFLKSAEKGGPLFLAKQLFLQTGNTFAETRLYNPLGVLIHAVPFVHRPRNLPLSPIQTNRGALQAETIKKFSPLRTASAPTPAKVNGFYKRPEDDLISSHTIFIVQPLDQRGQRKTFPIRQQLSNILPKVSTAETSPALDLSLASPLQKLLAQIGDTQRSSTLAQNAGEAIHRGDLSGKIIPTVEQGRPSITLGTRGSTKTLYDSGSSYIGELNTRPVSSSGNFTTESIKTNSSYFTQKIPGVSGNTTFRSLTTESAKLNGYFSGSNLIPADGPDTTTPSGSTSLIDPYNVLPASATAGQYSSITGSRPEKSDIINFVFTSIHDNNPVHFRAFISSLKQNIKPEYNETRYVGRTERFVTYAGAKRSATLEFNIVAFSPNEIEQVWTRVNYLTGLAFPSKASSSGFMAPPLFKLTMGSIYDNQPCYIDTLDFTMLDESTTFDIDKKVSQVIAVNMSITLLEKRSKFYDSPFYAIVEQLRQPQAVQS